MRVACAVSPPSRSASRGRLVGRVKSITTYPLKGARGESLRSSRVEKGSSVENDRAFALLRHENIEKRWSPGSDPETNAGDILRAGPAKDPGHHSNKHLFHQLITDPSLAKVSARRVGERGVQIVLPGSSPPRVLAACADVLVASEREPVERFFSTFLETASGEASKPPRLTFASGHSFANVGGKPGEHVLHINAAPSVEAAFSRLSSSKKKRKRIARVVRGAFPREPRGGRRRGRHFTRVRRARVVRSHAARGRRSGSAGERTHDSVPVDARRGSGCVF